MSINSPEFGNKNRVHIFLTRRCNNNCPHCYINLPLNAKSKELPAESWFKIIDQLVENGFGYLTLTGGEITVYPDLEKVYVYAKKKGLKVELMTNATNFSDDIKNMLLKYPPYQISVTIYGVDAETYTIVTGNKNGWKNFSDNIIFLDGLQKEKGTILSLSSVYTKETIKFDDKIKELGYKYTGKKTDFIIFLYGRMDKNNSRNKLIDSVRLSSEQLKEVVLLENKEKKDKGIFKQENTKSDKLIACHSLLAQESPYFLEDGTMSYCIIMPEGDYVLKPTQDELDNYNYKIMKEKLGKKLEPLLELKTNKICANCIIRDSCITCPIRNLLNGEGLSGFNKDICFAEIAKK